MEKICEECGKTFNPRTNRQLTCSKKCSESRHNRQCRERNKITIEKNMRRVWRKISDKQKKNINLLSTVRKQAFGGTQEIQCTWH